MVSSDHAPEAAPELIPELVLSVAHGMVPDLVHALSIGPAPLPAHGVGREVEKEAVPFSLAPPGVQRAWWVEEVWLWLLGPPESSSLGAIFKRINYFNDGTSRE